MTVYSGLFNSVNGDRKYNAWWFALYFNTFIGNGIFPNPSNNLRVEENEHLKTVVRPGKAWINGYFLFSDEDYILQHDPSNAILARVDRVVLRLDYLTRQIEIAIKKGDNASSPIPKPPQRDDDLHELVIADVLIPAGSIEITTARITDTRLNKDLCGIMHGLVDQVDTTNIFNQYESWFTEYSVTKASEFLAWQNRVTSDLENWIQSEQLDFQDWRQTQEDLFEAWFNERKDWFDSWFLTIKDILDTNAAGNLFNLIEDHKDSSMPHKFLIGSQVYKYGLAHNPNLDCVSFIYEEVQ